MTDDGPQRVQKVLARAGVASRRVAEDLIAAGRVRVDGKLVVLGNRMDPATQLLELDGAPISLAPGLVHYLLNKPTGVISTASDPQGRRTVVDLVPDEPRVFPVGRLDGDTEGLLLLTNNGELTHRLTHPSYGVEKEYLAEVEGTLSSGQLRHLREGVELDDGMTSPAKASQPSPGMVRLTIHEGRNRQVRRMLDAVGHPVRRLVRTRVGPLSDRNLAPGAWRHLSEDELRELERAVSGNEAPVSRAERRAAAQASQAAERPGDDQPRVER
ncbi:MAG: pseudouridine synthase [Microthrixaceae bacterium]